MKNKMLSLMCAVLCMQSMLFADGKTMSWRRPASDSGVDYSSTLQSFKLQLPTVTEQSSLSKKSTTPVAVTEPTPRNEQGSSHSISYELTPKQKITKKDSKVSYDSGIVISDWKELPDRQFEANTAIQYKKNIYIVEEDIIESNSRTLKLAEKKSITLWGRKLMTVTITKYIAGGKSATIQAEYEYYNIVKWSLALLAATMSITVLDRIGLGK